MFFFHWLPDPRSSPSTVSPTVKRKRLAADVQSAVRSGVVVGYGSVKTERSHWPHCLASARKTFRTSPIVDASQRRQGGWPPGWPSPQNLRGVPGGDVKIRIRGAQFYPGRQRPHLLVVDGNSGPNINLSGHQPQTISKSNPDSEGTLRPPLSSARAESQRRSILVETKKRKWSGPGEAQLRVVCKLQKM